MKSAPAIFALVLCLNGAADAQDVAARHEIGLTLGGLAATHRSSPATALDLGSGVALQANYGYRLFSTGRAALYGEVHLLAIPLRNVSSNERSLTSNAATLFVTPGIRVKFAPGSRIAPYLAAGAGWADYEQSTTTLAGAANPAPRHVNHAVVDYGGGVDFRLWRFVGLRAEVRDFYSGSPAYNSLAIRGSQHNVVAGGGLVLKFQ